MEALAQMIHGHPIASAWVGFAIGAWVVIYASTGGGRRRRIEDRDDLPATSDQA